MSDFISLSQAFTRYMDAVRESGADQNDEVAMSEGWNDYTDHLCKDGQLCALQYHYAPGYGDDMPGTGRQYDELSDDREFILSAMGVTMEAAFVPFSQSRSKADKTPSLNWVVKIKVNGREVIRADYMQGSGHAPSYKTPIRFASGKRDQWSTDKAIALECESGLRARKLGEMQVSNGKAKIDPPDIADVLYSLLRDASAVDEGGFADWCDSMGMDSDSIKARGIYDACIETHVKLRGAFGADKLEQLNELFEGM